MTARSPRANAALEHLAYGRALAGPGGADELEMLGLVGCRDFAAGQGDLRRTFVAPGVFRTGSHLRRPARDDGAALMHLAAASRPPRAILPRSIPTPRRSTRRAPYEPIHGCGPHDREHRTREPHAGADACGQRRGHERRCEISVPQRRRFAPNPPPWESAPSHRPTPRPSQPWVIAITMPLSMAPIPRGPGVYAPGRTRSP